MISNFTFPFSLNTLLVLLIGMILLPICSIGQCPSGALTLSTQQEIDDFAVNYPGCTILPSSLLIEESVSGNITNLNGLSQIEQIQLALGIRNNASLSSLEGLNNLTTVIDNCIIFNNSSILDLNGLNSISFIGDSFHVLNNNSLQSLDGVELLNTIGDELIIKDNLTLNSISSLSSLNEIGGLLVIWANNSLANLFGLENIDYASITSLTIRDNIILSICNVQSVCDYIENNPGLATIENNAIGCNTELEVDAECDSCVPANQNDFDALMALYNGTDGDNWTNNTGWADGAAGTDCDYCNWYGIECDGNDRVTCIDFDEFSDCGGLPGGNGNNLSGQLPIELGELEFLQYLNITENVNLIGPIPSQLGNLQNLFALSLSDNNLDGPIPPNLTNLSNLRYLILWNNELTGSIPLNIGMLTNLSWLGLYHNNLDGTLPSSLYSISSLERILIHNNNFSGTIGDLSSLINLEVIALYQNQFSGNLPESLGQLTNLWSINFQHNNFEGCFPNNYISLCDIFISTFFQNNQYLPWEGDFDEFCLTDGSQEAQVGKFCDDGDSGNNTYGPDQIQEDCSCGPCTHPDYNALMALYNSTDGDNWTESGTSSDPTSTTEGWGKDCIPCEWVGVSCDGADRVIGLNFNNDGSLVGSIPEEIGQLTFAEDLHFSNCSNLTGNLPNAIYSMSNLQFIDFQACDLNGTLGDFSSLVNLTNLWLNGNNFTGNFPESLSTLNNLTRIQLNSNNLDGTLPVSIGDFSNINWMWLQGNQFSGELPSSLGNLTTVTVLNLNNNEFEGCIPEEIQLICPNVTSGNISGNPLLDTQSWTDFCNNQEGICITCPTDYTITYPESACLGESFDFQVDIIGGSGGPYDISIKDGLGIEYGQITNTTDNPVTITVDPSIANGTYTFIAEITDNGNACPDIIRTSSSTDEMNIFSGGFGIDVPANAICFQQPYDLTINVSPDPISNGPYSVTITEFPGSATYTNSSSSETFTVTIPGNSDGVYDYSGILSDQSGCFYNSVSFPNVTVENEGIVDVTLPSDPTCENDPYQIRVDALGGLPTYDINLFENGIFIETQTVGMATDNIVTAFFDIIDQTAADYDYTITITDQLGCDFSIFYSSNTHTVFSNPNISNNVTISACQETTEEVSINLTLYNDELSFGNTIIWSNNIDGTNVISNPDTYTTAIDVTVFAQASDDNCVSEIVPVVINLTGSPIPTINTLGGQPIICPGSSLELSISGTYDDINWSTGEMGAFIEVSDPGTYTVTVTQGTCTGSNSILISNTDFMLDACIGEESTIVINTTDASFPIEIEWSGPENGNANTSSNSYNIEDLISGDYTITVTDNSGCSQTCQATVTNTPSNCTHPDVPNLIALYNATNDAGWTNKSGWVEGVAGTNCDPCGVEVGNSPWFGISCENNRVVQLELDSNNLVGEIVLLSGLDSLQELYLQFNDLQGGNWNFDNPNLKLINISLNRNLKTTLPNFNLPKLEELYCFGDSLIGSLPSFENVALLREAFIYNNQFTGEIPNWQLDSLRGLSLFNCGLTGMLPSLDASTEMLELFADSNALTGPLLPYDHMESLHTYVIRNNNLSGCFPERDFCDFMWFDATTNPLLPFEGEYQNVCDGESEIGAPCDDGNETSSNDSIQDDCSCLGEGGEMRPFVTTWFSNPNASNGTILRIPTHPDSDYNYEVDWYYDGNFIADSVGLTGDFMYDFEIEDTIKIAIRGDFPRINFEKLNIFYRSILNIDQWGDIEWTSMDGSFTRCINLNSDAVDAPDLRKVTSLARMFEGCEIFNAQIEHWATDSIETMYSMFLDADEFNQSLNGWNTGNVTSMVAMFRGADLFNGSIDQWDVKNVESMRGMFSSTSNFNSPIGDWDVGNVRRMDDMFEQATNFNQPIDNWNVSNVTNMSSMFSEAEVFDQPVGSWDVGNVTDMNSMFNSATSFNQPIDGWNVENVTDMGSLFFLAENFNQPINSWNVENVIDMESMFFRATTFNQPLQGWNVSNVTTMTNMFRLAKAFNQPLNNWDVSNSISLRLMFTNADRFDQSLENWNLNQSVTFNSGGGTTFGIFDDCGLSCENYAKTLQGWAANPNTPSGRSMQAANIEFGTDAEAARDSLISILGWAITGDVELGEICSLEEPCGELSCSPNMDFAIVDMQPNAMPISRPLSNGTEVFDCFSYDPILDIDTIYFDCDDVCIDSLITIYNLETGDSCSTWVSIVAITGVCGDVAFPEVKAELVDVTYTGQEFIEVDMLISGFIDINEYRFEVSFDNDLLEYVDTTNANLEIDPRINLRNNGTEDYIIVWSQDGVQTHIDQEAETRLVSFLFRPIVLPFCNSTAIKLSEPKDFGNVALTCQSYINPIQPEVIDAQIFNELLPPDFNPAEPQICDGSAVTISIANASDYASIIWEEGQTMSEITLSPDMTQDYAVALVDNKGCSLDTFITIEVADELSVDISSTDLCDNAPQNISVSNQFDNYNWEFDGTSIGGNDSQLLISEMGTYTIVVTDLNGCTGSATAIIENFESPNVELSQDTLKVCDNNAEGVTEVDLTALTSESGVWSTTSMINIDNPSLIDFNGLPIGLYEFIFTTNTAIVPCVEASDTVFVLVTSCSDCAEGGCLAENLPVWIDTESMPNITVTCISDIPPPMSLMFTNGLEDNCLSEGSIQPVRNESNFDGCTGTITDVWNYTTICGDDIQPYERTITVMQEGTIEFSTVPEANIEISCDDVKLLEIDLEYEIIEGSECIDGGVVKPIISENYDDCGGTVDLVWTINLDCYDELTFTQNATIIANDNFEFQDLPSDITISCDQLPFEPQVLIVSNDLNAACAAEAEVIAVTVPENADCPGNIVNTWAYIHPCTGEQLSHSQIVTVEECPTPILEEDYVEVRAGEIYNFDLIENDIVTDSLSISLVDLGRVELFLANDLNPNGVFDFAIEHSFFDTIFVTYEVCNLECDVCSTSTLKIVDEELKDIFLTDIITPDGDGMNDALRFNFEDEIPDAHIYIFNRWGSKVYEKVGYTNDWDANGYPGGVYYYVLRVGRAVTKKTLTVVK